MPTIIDTSSYARDTYFAFYKEKYASDKTEIFAQGLLALKLEEFIDPNVESESQNLGTLAIALNESRWWIKNLYDAVLETDTNDQLIALFGAPLSAEASGAAGTLADRSTHDDIVRQTVAEEAQIHLDGYLGQMEDLLAKTIEKLQQLKERKKLLLKKKIELQDAAQEMGGKTGSNSAKAQTILDAEIAAIDRQISSARKSVWSIGDKKENLYRLNEYVDANANQEAYERMVDYSKVPKAA